MKSCHNNCRSLTGRDEQAAFCTYNNVTYGVTPSWRTRQRPSKNLPRTSIYHISVFVVFVVFVVCTLHICTYPLRWGLSCVHGCPPSFSSKGMYLHNPCLIVTLRESQPSSYQSNATHTLECMHTQGRISSPITPPFFFLSMDAQRSHTPQSEDLFI